MTKPVILVSSDHRGFALKATFIAWLRRNGYEPRPSPQRGSIALLLVGAAALMAFLAPSPTLGEPLQRRFDIPAGSLTDAIITIGRQSGLNIGSDERGLATIRVEGLHGTMSVDEALRHVLAGTGLAAVRVPGIGIRIERAPPLAPEELRAAPPPPQTIQELIVTASKQGASIGGYPGSATIVDISGADSQLSASRSTGMIVDQFPFLATTNLGPGRDKLFIRGVADSSFTGASQATVGQYLGDVQMNYNGPDPNLNLYDIDRVEILEGPQGTLYGAGSLGGILRLVPHPAVPGRWHASAMTALDVLSKGGAGGDVAAMLNVPVIGDTVGLRLVGYGAQTPGYIDDIRRARTNVNRAQVAGGRALMRIAPGDGWTIDIGGVSQAIRSRDSQYAETTAPPLSRASAIAQPASNRFLLGELVARKQWANGLELVSASAIVRHHLTARYDASDPSPGSAVVANDTVNRGYFITQETRLSNTASNDRGWVVGVNGVFAVDRVTSQFTPRPVPDTSIGVRNQVIDVALFGQVTFALTRRLNATLGGRWTYAEISSHAISFTEDGEEEHDRGRRPDRVRFLPTGALAWRFSPTTTGFLRFQEGYRAGGLAVGQGDTELFRSDTLNMVELGVRFGRSGVSRLSGEIALSYSKWRDIQADLDGDGGPFTANVGDGRILGFESSLAWLVRPNLTASAAVFLNDSSLTRGADWLGRSKRESLPNSPGVTTRVGLDYQAALNSQTTLRLSSAARYVGRSQLGVGSDLHIAQGAYVDTSLSAVVIRGRLSASISASNLYDSRANRFAFGNPFGVTNGEQETPLQPRTIRLALQTLF